MKNRTTLQVKKEILVELRKCKRFEKETYNEVLKRLMKKSRKEVWK